MSMAVLRTLQDPSQAGVLEAAARSWAASVSSPADARSALLCLCEVTTELAGDVVDQPGAAGLDRVLEVLVAQAAAASAPSTAPASVDTVTGCPDRQAFGRDLAAAVADADLSGADVAVAVVKVHDVPKRTGLSRRPVVDGAVDRMLGSLRGTPARSHGVYRIGARKFAVLAPDMDILGVRELMLLATCVPGPRFAWGAASLRAVGADAERSPDLLLLLAESDLYLRSKDLAAATTALARRRGISVLASSAAATLLVGGVALGLDMPAAAPGYQVHVAEPVPVGSVPSGPPSRPSPPAPAPPPTNPPPPSSVPAPPPTPTSPPPASDVSNLSSPPSVHLTSTAVPGSSVPVATVPVTTVVPVVPVVVPPPRPVPTSVPTTVPVPVTTPVVHHGHSASAAGHDKADGKSSKHR